MKFSSNFPGGLSGAVLFPLRAALGVSAFACGAAEPANGFDSTIWNRVIGFFSIVCGAMIFVGFLTLLFTLIMCLGGITVAISKFSAFNNFSAVYVCVMAIALAALGAGAFSLDTRFFGRREIILPDDSVMPDL